MGKKRQELRKRSREEAEAEAEADEAKVAPAAETAAETEEEPMLIKDTETIRRAVAPQKATNRQKCLVLGSRNISGKGRHLLIDMRGLMPHSREHAKLASGDNIGEHLTDLCSLHHCNSLMFLEGHRHDVSFLWLAQAPNGPSVKFLVGNVHTADELRMAGNCLKYSRPLLHFDHEFESVPHLRVVKSLLQLTYNTPRYHPLSKPFVDHVFSFFFLDGHVWFRNYQIVDNGTNSVPSLMEIGPRFTLQPIVILNGCCQGSVLWKNPDAQAPTEVRRSRKLRQMLKAKENAFIKEKSEKHKQMYPDPEESELDRVFKD